MSHSLKCRCGTLRGHVDALETANRSICYCRDRQAFARYLGRMGADIYINDGRRYGPSRFDEKFTRFPEYWPPRVTAEMNDYPFKLVSIQGEFVWHQHDDTDEVFIVLGTECGL